MSPGDKVKCVYRCGVTTAVEATTFLSSGNAVRHPVCGNCGTGYIRLVKPKEEPVKPPVEVFRKYLKDIYASLEEPSAQLKALEMGIGMDPIVLHQRHYFDGAYRRMQEEAQQRDIDLRIYGKYLT